MISGSVSEYPMEVCMEVPQSQFYKDLYGGTQCRFFKGLYGGTTVSVIRGSVWRYHSVSYMKL